MTFMEQLQIILTQMLPNVTLRNEKYRLVELNKICEYALFGFRKFIYCSGITYHLPFIACYT